MIRGARRRAADRGLAFTITADDIVIPTQCPLLGIELHPAAERKDNRPSLDRIDSSRGYTPDNIQVISWRANRLKSDATPDELMRLACYLMEKTR